MTSLPHSGAAGIDVEAALLAAAHGKSSCASKEVEHQALAAALPNPPPPASAACRTPQEPPSPIMNLCLMSRTSLKGSIMFQPPATL